MGQRMPVRLLKWGSLILAVLGLPVLLYAALVSDTPSVQIGDLRGAMNWAYVEVEGVVSRQPTHDPNTGTLRLWLDDGTGEILVLAYRSEADTLLAQNAAPVMGDRVMLQGTVRIKEDFQYLVLNVAEHLRTLVSDPLETTIAGVEMVPLYQKVLVRGMIRDERTPYEGLHILTLRDETGEIEVAFSTSAVPGGGPPNLEAGQPVQVVGAVGEYNGRPQISIGRAGDLVLLEENVTTVPTRWAGDIGAGDVGSMALVEGVIREVVPFSAGVKYKLDDGSGTVTLLLWQNFYDQMSGSEALKEGAVVRVQGEIAEYRGDLEIVPQLQSDLEFVGTKVAQVPAILAASPTTTVQPGDSVGTPVLASPSPTTALASTPQPTSSLTPIPTLEPTWTLVPTLSPIPSLEPTRTPEPSPSQASLPTSLPTQVPAPTPETRVIGGISGDAAGQEFNIAQAGITGVSYFTRGIKYTLSDGTGSILLLLWQNVLEEVPGRYDLYPGSRVQVTGEIQVYEGDLEIIPQQGADVQIVAAGDRAPLEQRNVGDITPSDEGRLFTVEGVVSRLEQHRWLYIWLDDGTGEILVYVPERVLEYLPAGIGPGVRLRATGEVDIYNSILEIIPQAGSDVEVY